MEVDGLKDLLQRIELLEQKKARQQQALKSQMKNTVETLKPKNLVQGILGISTENGASSSNTSSFLTNAISTFTSPKNSLLSSLASVALGFVGKKLNKTVKNTSTLEVVNSGTRKGIVATIVTMGLGFLINSVFKTNSRNMGKVAMNSMLKTTAATLLLGNVDKIIAWVTAAIKTDFGKKTPQEV